MIFVAIIAYAFISYFVFLISSMFIPFLILGAIDLIIIFPIASSLIGCKSFFGKICGCIIGFVFSVATIVVFGATLKSITGGSFSNSIRAVDIQNYNEKNEKNTYYEISFKGYFIILKEFEIQRSQAGEIISKKLISENEFSYQNGNIGMAKYRNGGNLLWSCYWEFKINGEINNKNIIRIGILNKETKQPVKAQKIYSYEEKYNLSKQDTFEEMSNRVYNHYVLFL